jgi:hypothetical protein
VEGCSESGCAEASVVSLGERRVCRTHYLAHCYERLDAISKALNVKNYSMTAVEAESSGRFLQDCMRTAADFASSQQMPSNLEKAQVYDMLLWASELHGRLRRSPRKLARFPVLVRSEIPGRTWETRTETQVVSRHGMRLACSGDVHPKDTLTCIRLDNGRRTEATVVWAKLAESGITEVGLQFPHEENFWDIVWGNPPDSPDSTRR